MTINKFGLVLILLLIGCDDDVNYIKAIQDAYVVPTSQGLKLYTTLDKKVTTKLPKVNDYIVDNTICSGDKWVSYTDKGIHYVRYTCVYDKDSLSELIKNKIQDNIAYNVNLILSNMTQTSYAMKDLDIQLADLKQFFKSANWTNLFTAKVNKKNYESFLKILHNEDNEVKDEKYNTFIKNVTAILDNNMKDATTDSNRSVTTQDAIIKLYSDTIKKLSNGINTNKIMYEQYHTKMGHLDSCLNNINYMNEYLTFIYTDKNNVDFINGKYDIVRGKDYIRLQVNKLGETVEYNYDNIVSEIYDRVCFNNK